MTGLGFLVFLQIVNTSEHQTLYVLGGKKQLISSAHYLPVAILNTLHSSNPHNHIMK